VAGRERSGVPQEWVARAFTRVEDVVYVVLGLLLAASANRAAGQRGRRLRPRGGRR
jgi:hypothetical protein